MLLNQEKLIPYANILHPDYCYVMEKLLLMGSKTNIS